MPLTRAGSQPSGFIEKGMRDSLLQRLDRQSVEARDAVALRPQRDLARLREGPVTVLEELLAVQRHSEAIAPGPERQRVPLARSHLNVGARELLPAPVHDAIKADVVLERVRSGHVVVVLVLQADGEAPRLIDLARNRLEAGAHLNIRRRD